MPIFDVTVAITGTAYAQVVAESVEHARDMFRSGDFDLELNEWDSCTDANRGGFLDIQASRSVELDPVFEEDSILE